MFILISFYSQIAFASELDRVFSELKSSDKKMKTLRADFSQNISFNDTQEHQKIVGTIVLKKPDAMYIHQKTPQNQKIYIEGTTVTIYTPENNQAVINSWKNVVGSDFSLAFIINFAGKRKDMQKSNVMTLIEENEKVFVIKIEPIYDKGWLMYISISKDTMLVKKATVESTGLTTEITFSNYVVNPHIDKSDIQFTAPSGVEIIKLN
jgi:outer membrane lipoprotein carrier protein